MSHFPAAVVHAIAIVKCISGSKRRQLEKTFRSAPGGFACRCEAA